MKYDAESIERRKYITSRVKIALKKLLYIVLIIMLYNIFLITKSSLSQSGAKEVFGYRAYVIITDSMKPALRMGDVMITTKVPEDKIKAGNIITFDIDDKNISHRIVSIKENDGKKEYVTKGDNNNTLDTYEVTYNDIQGVKVLVIPYLGSIVMLLGNKVYIVLLALLVLLIFLRMRRIESKRKIRREKKRNADKKLQSETNNNENS